MSKEKLSDIEAELDMIRQLAEDRFKHIITKLKHLRDKVYKMKIEVMKEAKK